MPNISGKNDHVGEVEGNVRENRRCHGEGRSEHQSGINTSAVSSTRRQRISRNTVITTNAESMAWVSALNDGRGRTRESRTRCPPPPGVMDWTAIDERRQRGVIVQVVTRKDLDSHAAVGRDHALQDRVRADFCNVTCPAERAQC